MEENIFALINTLSRIYHVLRQSSKITFDVILFAHDPSTRIFPRSIVHKYSR